MGNSVLGGKAVSVENTGASGELQKKNQQQGNLKNINPDQINENGTLAKSKMEDCKSKVQAYIDNNLVMIFSKTTCSYCAQVKEFFKSLHVPFQFLDLDQTVEGKAIQETLFELTKQRTVPNVFVRKQHIGGCDKTLQAHKEGKLQSLLEMTEATQVDGPYDYDLIVIGGGSGGLAASKEAAKYGKKVLVLDYVVPTPLGTTWGIGGTCVNVGCIPKKLMHQAALLHQGLEDARKYGWEFAEQVNHNWTTMKEAIQSYIGSLNWGYRVNLRENNVTYVNSYAEFVGPHKIKATNKKGKETFYTTKTVILATGERPRYLGIPGDKEYCITSDDLFSLSTCPGKTLVVGASYVALECAGFLAGLGLDVTVMVRSILLRGFDQQMADLIGEYMESHGVKFIRQFVPTKIEQIEPGTPGKLKVTAQSVSSTETIEGEYNTVLLAVGRDACTKGIGLDTVGVTVNEKTGKIPVNESEQTNVPDIYAIGDILDGKLQLTPVAIQAGQLLARRLYNAATLKCDYKNVPTTVFTPLEYGACGYSEEDAIQTYGKDNLEVYHSNFWPLEWTVPGRDNNKCYSKIICDVKDQNRVIGFHVLGPNAGEITQGFAAAIKCGITKELLDNTIGIHPVCAEVFTTLSVSKRSGGDIQQSGC